MEMVERLDGVAEESSNGWNNAGTGHSALALQAVGWAHKADVATSLFLSLLR